MAKQFNFQPSKHPTLPDGYQRKEGAASDQAAEVVDTATRSSRVPLAHWLCLALGVVFLLMSWQGWGNPSIPKIGGGLVIAWAVAQWFMGGGMIVPLISACLGAAAISLQLTWAPLVAGLMKQAGNQVVKRRRSTRRY